ncbi:MAG: hypothetical protein ABI182_00905 [Candidatus Baltobacteraceae bacterium]
MRFPALCGAALFAFGLSTATGQTLPPTTHATPAAEVEPAVPRMPVRNAPIASYTFDLNAHIVMRTFPWLKFHISGKGRYERNGDLMLHLDGMPWFARAYQNVNMASVLEPQTWGKQYVVAYSHRHGGTVELIMHDRGKTPLTEARATIDDDAGLRELDWSYSYGGKIRLMVSPGDASGYTLPAVMNVEADMPRYAASAQAAFTNYRVVTDASGSATAE